MAFVRVGLTYSVIGLALVHPASRPIPGLLQDILTITHLSNCASTFLTIRVNIFSAAVALITKPVNEMIALVNCCSRQRGHTGYLLSVPVDFKNVQGLPAAIFSVPVNRRSGEHTGMKLRKFNLLTIMVIVIISLRLAFQSLQEGRQHIERPVIQRPLPDQNDSCFGLQSQKKDIKIPSAFLQYFSRHKCAFLQNFD